MRLSVGSGFYTGCVFTIIMILSVASSSCSKYPEVRLDAHDPFGVEDKTGQKSRVDEILDKYKISSGSSKSYPVTRNVNIISGRRYMVSMFSDQPLAEINNKGVEYALLGRLEEAEVLFSEALKEDNGYSPACNNLGVIFELSGNEKAFSMYSRACLLDPENEYYRQNLLCFCDRK